jgi:hypothetical protein
MQRTEGGGDQRVKESEWKMQRTEGGGGRHGKKPEWAMGRTRQGELNGCIMHQVHTSMNKGHLTHWIKTDPLH